MENTDWVSLAQTGDRAAFSELVRLYRSGVINVLYRMCNDANLAEDAAQVAFIRAWQHLPTFQPHTSFRNWLYRIAINTTLDMLRREKPVAHIDDLLLSAPVERAENHIEQQEQVLYIRKVVHALPEASRAVLILREYEGLSYQEIADTLEISIGTVMSRLNYARGRLKELLRPYLEEL